MMKRDVIGVREAFARELAKRPNDNRVMLATRAFESCVVPYIGAHRGDGAAVKYVRDCVRTIASDLPISTEAMANYGLTLEESDRSRIFHKRTDRLMSRGRNRERKAIDGRTREGREAKAALSVSETILERLERMEARQAHLIEALGGLEPSIVLTPIDQGVKVNGAIGH